jgi:hypothetical protein
MRKLMSALSLTLLLTVNTLADTADTPAATPPADTSTLVAIIIVVASIAIPNLLKSRQG